VLEVPLQWEPGLQLLGDTQPVRLDYIFLYYATFHKKPLVSGMAARYPQKRVNILTSIGVYRQLLALEHEPGFSDAPTFTAADLKSLGIGYVVYHRDLPQPEAYAYLAGLGLPVLADDGTVIVWKVP
jgi:hypothetical protein